MQCAHGDVALYPLAEVELEQGMEAEQDAKEDRMGVSPNPIERGGDDKESNNGEPMQEPQEEVDDSRVELPGSLYSEDLFRKCLKKTKKTRKEKRKPGRGQRAKDRPKGS